MDLSIVTLLEGGLVDQDETQLKQMLPPDFLKNNREDVVLAHLTRYGLIHRKDTWESRRWKN